MSNATIQDEDLIILSDSTSSDTSLIDFNFDIPKTEVNEAVIDFGTSETSTKPSISFDFDSEVTSTGTNEPSINFLDETSSNPISSPTDDIFNFSEPVEETSQLENTLSGEKETILTPEETDFSSINEVSMITETPVILEEPVQKSDILSSFNRNDILQDAIAKMQSRKEVIATAKSSKKTKVDELNEQIKKLKKEVSQFEGEIKELEKEDTAIDLDIVSFEKMKSAMVDVSERTRTHNLDNIKKK